MSNTARCVTPVLLLMLLSLSSGCSWVVGYRRPLTFRLIDADTRQPLGGVQAEQHGISNSLGYEPELKKVLPHSGANGIVTTAKLDKKYNHEFSFKKTGYQTTGAVFYPAHPNEIDVPLPASDPDFGRKAATISSKGLIVIPMYREPPAMRPSRPTTGKT